MPENTSSDLPPIIKQERRTAPAIAPQALAFHEGNVWISSRDLRRVYVIDPASWKVREEFEVPGIPWAAVSVGDALWFTLGEGENDDRYLRHYVPGQGFSTRAPIACPDFTGSYLSFEGEFLYLSQWYKGLILRLDQEGKTLREFDVGMEICGHTIVDGVFYVLRGTEAGDESWRISRFDPSESNPTVVDLAAVTFQSRSLAFDGQSFWSNHRAADQTVSFHLP
ncbi:MAG: hypothetical protein ABI946_11615 [Chthoniobacterales bacterium]